MKKKIIVFLVIFMLVLAIGIFSVIPINKKYQNSPWMKDVADSKLITEMSIPGTHDSGATHSIFDVSGKCQELSIENQLKIGVRFFDIRLQIVNDKLNVVHSFVDQDLSFIDVLEDFNSYIENNQSEFLIISIKEDYDSKNSNVEFKSKVKENLENYNNIVFDTSLPKTLGEARGKIFILNRYCSEDIGIPAYYNWKDSTSFELGDLYVQDNYCINDINIKKEDIVNTIKYSNESNDKLVLCFTSCYLDYGFPPTYAVTPATTLNKWFISYVNENKDSELGIVIVDFITEEIAKLIYMRN